MHRAVWLAIVAIGAGRTAAAQTGAVCGAIERDRPLGTAEFETVMTTVAAGWNEGDSRKAANCFTADAVYLEPPDRQRYLGREALFEFFGGAGQPPSPGRMTWHHLLFDEARQIGVGEYTYRGRNVYHGIAIVRLHRGLISHWREYQYQSSVEWDEFVGPSRF